MKVILGHFLLAVCAASAWQVILPDAPLRTEETAARELRTFLPASGGRFVVGGQEIAEIHVGCTSLARTLGLARDKAEADSWLVRRIGPRLFVNGGGQRGVLYGAYALLEEACGVCHFSPAESAPSVQSVILDSVDTEGRFHFAIRDIYVTQFPKDGGRFAVASGLSRDGDREITPDYGGAFDYGPPYSCHTFDRYISAKEHLRNNPEYFSLRGGRRVGGQTKGQLCLSNPKMRSFFAELLLKNIRESQAEAARKGLPPPVLFDVSQNDNGAFCECPQCAEAIAKEHVSGYVLEFVNWLAEKIEAVYPQVKLQTFAYFSSLEPPVTVRARNNVIVRLCNTSSDMIGGAASNPQFRSLLARWRQSARELYVWDYAIVYGDCTGLPLPSEFHYPNTYRLYAENQVTGVFWEQESPDRSDMWELKHYLHAKYMAEPFRNDLDNLLERFHTAYYGKAAPFTLAWRRLLRDAAERPRSRLPWVPTIGDYEFITWPVMAESQRLLEQARQAVAEQPDLLRRVNRAAMGMDRLLGYEATRRFISEFAAAGGDRHAFPLDILAVRRRFRDTWEESQKRCAPSSQVRERLLRHFEQLDDVPMDYPAPPRFANVPHLDIAPVQMPLVMGREMSIERDASSETGVAMVIDADANRKSYQFPETFGVYNRDKAAGIVSKVFQRERFPQGEYCWIEVANVRLPAQDSCYLWLTNSWKIQIPLDNLGPLDRTRRITAHILVKFTGDLFYGDGSPSRIRIGRVVLTQGND